jgi:hypothetical protein
MTYYADLSPYEYSRVESSTRNVGWLDAEHKYLQGTVPDAFVEQLLAFCQNKVHRSKGFHICELCNRALFDPVMIKQDNQELLLGSAEIRVFAQNGLVYAAPDLIYHYVVEHHYQPPDEFIQAVLEGPQPGTPEYQELITPWIDPYYE